MDHSGLFRLCHIAVTLLIAVAILAAAHSLGLAFEGTQLPASAVLAFHSVLTGALLHWFIWAKKRQLVGGLRPWQLFANLPVLLGLGAVALIDLILGSIALYRHTPESLPFGALALVGLLCGKACLEYIETKKDDGEPVKDPDLDAAVAAETSRFTPKDHFSGFAGTIFSSLLTMILLMSILSFGFLYFYFLRDAFLEHKVWDLARIARVTLATLNGSWPRLIGIVAAITLVFGAMSLWKAFASWRRKQIQPDIDRDLTEAELALIRGCTTSLEAYVSQSRTSFTAKLVHWTAPLALMLGLFAGIFLLLMTDMGLFAGWFIASRTEGFDQFIYRDGIGFADVLLVFDAILLAAAIPSYLCRNWEELCEYNLRRAKTEGRKDGDPLGTLREDIALDVRKRLITALSTFEPKPYLLSKSRDDSRIIYGCLAACLVATSCFWYLDRRSYDLITADQAITVDYWSGERFEWRYGMAEAVEITCYRGPKNKLELTYDMVFPGDHGVRVADGSEQRELKALVTQSLPLWQTIDAQLHTAGVPRYFGARDLVDDKRADRFTPATCSNMLTKQFDARTARAVMQLLTQRSPG